MDKDLAEQLVDAISQLGPNKARVPYAADYHDGEWWVYIDIDTRHGTFDIETHSPVRADAFRNAFSRLRRELTCAA